jgi:thioredoxin 2
MMRRPLPRRRQQLAGQAQLAKLDTEAYPQAAAPFGIRSIPTMVIFKEGRNWRISRALPASEIVRWVRSVI